MSVLLVEETGVPGENQTCCKSLTKFIKNFVSSTPRLIGVGTHNFCGDRH